MFWFSVQLFCLSTVQFFKFQLCFYTSIFHCLFCHAVSASDYSASNVSTTAQWINDYLREGNDPGKAWKQLYSKLQNRPLVREGATKLQTNNCLKEISRRKKNWSQVPDGRLTPGQTGRLTVGRKLTSTSTSNRSTIPAFAWKLTNSMELSTTREATRC
jgi:hypothetical protein